MAAGCDNQTAVDSLAEQEDEQNVTIPEGRLQIEARSGLQSGLASEITLSDEMRKQLKELGIDPDQIQFSELSEDTKWFVGIDAFKKEGTGPVVLNEGLDSCGPDGSHCEEPDPCSIDPGSPPYPGDPDPPSPIPPAIQLARNSYVLCSPFANAVEMASWSWASQPIDFISVTGISLKDGAGVSLTDSRNNGYGAIVGIIETYHPWENPLWSQSGQHTWQNAGDTVIRYSGASRRCN